MNIPVPYNYSYIVTHRNIGSRLLSYKFVVCSIGYRVFLKFLTKLTISLKEYYSFNYEIKKSLTVKDLLSKPQRIVSYGSNVFRCQLN